MLLLTICAFLFVSHVNTLQLHFRLDRSLIRLCAKFANYETDNPASFRLDAEYSLYPQFMFHLRRSQFLQTSNASPDESTYYRIALIGETASNSLVMIQPSLIRYSFKAPPTPVLLDTASINADEILLLDTFFHVVIHHGATIASWREQNFQARPDHLNFKALLEACVPLGWRCARATLRQSLSPPRSAPASSSLSPPPLSLSLSLSLSLFQLLNDTGRRSMRR